ncbi:uncharacterized protein BXZ73DRAFT_104643 [Epithele typhae]|uniref:uncharacterized protein n=1 Tax=Epithele typhae TaxID=378194 RepID=UPI0020078347|nr:uncharacterized protein BXZ73DRAFT_104643 [Epithele typhae]KAH9920518.1 hypothetical protein BXZ73DRAFT_104643 [Epithele typhae]
MQMHRLSDIPRIMIQGSTPSSSSRPSSSGIALPTGGNVVGESPSPLLGEIRLASDGFLARDPHTAREWQSFVTDHTAMNAMFKAVMAKLVVVYQDAGSLYDFSEVIPVPKGIGSEVIRAGKTLADIERSCAGTPSPKIATLLGAVHPIPTVPSS